MSSAGSESWSPAADFLAEDGTEKSSRMALQQEAETIGPGVHAIHPFAAGAHSQKPSPLAMSAKLKYALQVQHSRWQSHL